MAYDGNPRKAVELYVGDEYIQHNPLVGDGKVPFIEYLKEIMEPKYPGKSIEFVRAISEGDLLPYTLTKYGLLMKNMSICIYSTIQEKSLGIGMPCN